MPNSDWFKSWFDSPYYHILYKDRDHKEAEGFIAHLIDYLKPGKESVMLDLACGSGRHSLQLSKYGYEVYGVDLSENSIDEALMYANDHLHFEVHDMRKVYKQSFFDFEFSLFTSLGYFMEEEDNKATFKAMSANLKNSGTLIVDFMNSVKTVKNLKLSETKIVDGISFEISREHHNGIINKTIEFDTDQQSHSYSEHVRAFTLEDFRDYYSQNSLEIVDIFGDYELNPFNDESSDRLILIARKKWNS